MTKQKMHLNTSLSHMTEHLAGQRVDSCKVAVKILACTGCADCQLISHDPLILHLELAGS